MMQTNIKLSESSEGDERVHHFSNVCWYGFFYLVRTVIVDATHRMTQSINLACKAQAPF